MFAWIEQKEDTKLLVQATLSRTGLHMLRFAKSESKPEDKYQDQFFQWSLKVSNVSGLLRQRAAQKIACRRQLEQDRKSMEKLYSGEEWETNAADNILPLISCDAVSWMCSIYSNLSDPKSSQMRVALKAKPSGQEQWRSFATSSRGKMISRSLRPTSMNKSCSDALEVWSPPLWFGNWTVMSFTDLWGFENPWICKNDFQRKNSSKRQEMDLFHGFINLFFCISLFGVRACVCVCVCVCVDVRVFVCACFLCSIDMNVSVATCLNFQACCQKPFLKV